MSRIQARLREYVALGPSLSDELITDRRAESADERYVSDRARDAVHMLDASALLALMLGDEAVQQVLPGARVSAVNFSEVVAKLQERGVPDDVILQSLAELDPEIVPFDREQAHRAGLLCLWRRARRGFRWATAPAAAVKVLAIR